MKILLIQPLSPITYRNSFPLGLGYIAACLREAGHHVLCWDMNVSVADRQQPYRELGQWLAAVQLVGITGLTGDYPVIKGLVCEIRGWQPETKIVIGGHLASALPEFLVGQLPIDAAVIGEGEDTIVELAACGRDASRWHDIHGLCLRDGGGRIVRTPTRPRTPDLDRLPFPAWDLFPMEAYLKGANEQNAEYATTGTMSIMASRGCPRNCIYCDHTIKGFRPRYRSVENAIAEINAARRRYGNRIGSFYFWDDILIWDRQWIEAFCRQLIDRQLNVKWTCNAHVDKVEPELMHLMKAAGCFNVRFGIESGSQKILDSLDKGVRVEKALRSLQVCLHAGLSLTLYLMIGAPGESDATVAETASFFKQLVTPFNVYQVSKTSVFLLTPFPGSRLFDRLYQSGRIPDLEAFLQRGFDASNDLPFNLSDMDDQYLLAAKENLENQILQILEQATNQMHITLLGMRKAAAK